MQHFRAPAPLAFATVLAFVTALVSSQVFAGTEPMRATAPAPAAGAAKAPAVAPAPLSKGTVLETMDAGNYTYARVKTDKGEQWLAGPKTPLRVGDEVTWPGGMAMPNFVSKSLGRTFESIVFVDRLQAGGAPTPATGAGAAGAAAEAAAPHANLAAKDAGAAQVTGIEKADGGLTVAEVYDRRADLSGKEVVVRGKVVKFNADVMKRNWLHLRDGSSGKGGENDLTVTSDATAAVGDVVTVRGKLALDRDFGFGYRYGVLVEGATVTPQGGR